VEGLTSVYAFQPDGENGMGARGAQIHHMPSNTAILLSLDKTDKAKPYSRRLVKSLQRLRKLEFQ
jgi:hypothetical protein